MRSRRMAAAVTTLAVVASGLVSAAVIGVGPVLADHCDPAEATQSPQASQTQQPNQNRNQDQNQDQGQQQDQDQQGQQQDQQTDQNNQQNDQQQNDQQNDQQGTGQNGDQQGDDQQAPQGGGIALLDPAQSPDGTGDNGTGDNGTGDAADPDAGNTEADNPEAAPEETANTFGRRRGGNQSTRTPTPSPSQTQSPTASPTASPTGSASPSPTATGGEEEQCADLGPFPEDFVDIRQVGRVNNNVRFNRNGSRGTFVSRCGTNQNGHNNPDNFIVAPGVSNGAHHLHDYVGNLSTDAFSTDESLAAAGTTCQRGDLSTYFWPVLRDRRSDANASDPDGNVGQVLRARAVSLEFRGNPSSRVVAMPRFLRLITGDAKAATNGGANAKAAWTCTGFQNRITTDKYPLCPRGSQVVRILDFPSCWDGQNTDSANHRTHVVFPGQGGACPQGTRAIPQLRMTLTYSVPQGPSFALDAFPEQKHNPVTDHADFANVMPDRLMQFVVSCINRGRRC
ncbi:DUF1996 domain-containing protein [Nonomuraea gerenzanensis]|uniref:Secreted protein n=1 Tax=Nonomuraea gerenzanensis TaxID=93944 RepID=A0A1M4E114_9ACTN|nr:DUF1996 domain-containing protein [Nonomuraea gerenzanensis]UBU14763.1 DUF1996 domain-containing protein [Nonomuraea gerenzanensis]SBO92491.1 secreted protein [Nonomuraea gerenzanensis]